VTHLTPEELERLAEEAEKPGLLPSPGDRRISVTAHELRSLAGRLRELEQMEKTFAILRTTAGLAAFASANGLPLPEEMIAHARIDREADELIASQRLEISSLKERLQRTEQERDQLSESLQKEVAYRSDLLDEIEEHKRGRAATERVRDRYFDGMSKMADENLALVERISQLEQELKERAVQVLQAKQETEVWKKGAQAVEATNSYCQQLEKENREKEEALEEFEEALETARALLVAKPLCVNDGSGYCRDCGDPCGHVVRTCRYLPPKAEHPPKGGQEEEKKLDLTIHTPEENTF
jgi:DNA repair exonuclease SbcCD ATPase subunit